MEDDSRGMIPSSRRGERAEAIALICGARGITRTDIAVERDPGSKRQSACSGGCDRVNSTSAGGAAEGSQGQAAFRAATGLLSITHDRPERT